MPKLLSEYTDAEIREVEAYFDIVKSNYASETIMSKAVYISLACMQAELDRRNSPETDAGEIVKVLAKKKWPITSENVAETLAKEFRFTRR